MNLQWKRVSQVTLLDEESEVYNFEVEDNQNYFAEGILVHNCFANSFRSSLYTAFFDNSKDIGLRWANPKVIIPELDKLMKLRGSKNESLIDVQKAIAIEMPIRFGIRFEDFLWDEKEKGVALEVLRYLSSQEYPVMINTKSDLVADDDYVDALASNKGKSAVHITMISSDPVFNRRMESGAPTFEERIKAAKILSDAGVRVVARIEPFMVFLNDEKEEVDRYISMIRDAGIKHITFDTYSYSAYSPTIRKNIVSIGYDFDRMFALMSDAQWIGSLLLGKFMKYMREQGFNCNTFDQGNAPSNDDDICCSVGDLFTGFCYGNTMSAIRYIVSRGGKPASWRDFHAFVMSKGGFLSPSLEGEVHHLWNIQGNNAYSIDWAQGLVPVGSDDGGLVWAYKKDYDFRMDMLHSII